MRDTVSGSMKKPMVADRGFVKKVFGDGGWTENPNWDKDNEKSHCHIGAANPFVVARMILGYEVNLIKADRELIQAFGMPYNLIFNSKNNALIYSPKLVANKLMEIMKKSSFSSGSFMALNPILFFLPMFATNAQVGAAAKNRGSPKKIQKAPSNPSFVYRPAPADERQMINDCVQGASIDCYFIAALYSNTWMNYTAIGAAKCPLDLTNEPFTIRFYYKDLNGVKQSYDSSVDSRIILDVNNLPVYASPTEQNESYPSVYEKAYAKFHNFLVTNQLLPKPLVSDLMYAPDGSPIEGRQSGDLDIGTLSDGSPLNSLFNLTGKKYDFSTNNITNFPSAFLIRDIRNNDNPILKIPNTNPVQYMHSYDILIKYNAVINGNSSKTKYPTVAWTYDPGNQIPDDPIPGDASYSDTTIASRHTYSVLGTLTNGAGKYIVLRNPWGKNYAGDITALGWDKLANGIWTPKANITQYLGKLQDNSIRTDGLFGLKQEWFESTFQGIGWVRFT